MRSSAPGRAFPLIVAAIAASIAGACDRGTTLRVHYLPGFVAGTEHLFSPVSIAVVPATGSYASGRFKAGSIYNADNSVAGELYVKDLGGVATDAVVQGLAGAGLKPFALASAPGSAFPPDVALMLAVEIEDAAVNKRFGMEQTVHGQYFSMKAQVRLRFTLSTRANPHLYSTVTTGTEEEPPAPVGGEVFFPLETEPAESLSVALSRALGTLILQPYFQHIVASQTFATPHSHE
ncbi:MAG TPA: hypothetical protein VJX23_15565 [Candidatus Binataceae bacterium]|nr:hypothetical protein [Candidatus Binataceae bacterium]